MARILCPHCGTANREGSRFCNRCGTDLRPEDLAPIEPGGGQPEPAPSEMPPAEQPGVTAEANKDALTNEQPWLRADFVGEDDVPLSELEEEPPLAVEGAGVPTVSGRLVAGLQGQLPPIGYAVADQDTEASPLPTPTVSPAADDLERLRRVRTLMAEEPILASSAPVRPQRDPSLWLPWVFWVIGLAVAVPVLLGLTRPAGEPRTWPGVEEAAAAIASLPPQATVQVLWAYDPATAGELDLVAAPVLRQLLGRGVQLDIVSLLPAGPATARRLVTRLQEEQRTQDLYRSALPPVNPRFLPGGATVLPLLGLQTADLAVVFAARAEDVQQWLELVAPANRVPVVAVTAAGADPPLRPYWESGQLVGLVSGFDGAYAFTRLDTELPTRVAEARLRTQIVGENFALVALLGVILAGNLAALLSGRRRDG